MDNTKPILVAVDLTEHTDGVVRAAVVAAKAFRTRVVVCHVVHRLESLYGIYVGASSVHALQQEVEARARVELHKHFLAHLADSGIEGHEEVRVGIPWTEIIGAALRWDAGMIVLGAHALTKPEHRVLGSTAERILRHAACPVLVVPAPSPG